MTNTGVTISFKLFKSLSTIFYLSRFFCLLPLKWSNLNSTYIVTKSKNYTIYSLFLITLIVASSGYGLSRAYRLDLIHSIRLGTTAAHYVNYADVAIVVGTPFIGVVVTVLKLDKFVKYFYHVNQFDNEVKIKSLDLSKFKLVTMFTISAATVLLFYDLANWVRLGAHNEKFYIVLIYFFPYYLSYFFNIVMELLYWHFTYSIKIRLKALNEKFGVITTGNDKTHKGKNNNAVHIFNEKVPPLKFVTHLDGEMGGIIKGYLHLVSAVNYVNDCYGPIILTVLFGCFIHLLVTPYALRTIIMNEGGTIFIVSQILWLLAHITRLLLVVEPCNGCKVQMKHLSLVVCQLLFCNPDKNKKKSLKLLLLCLSQCKIKFSACGLAEIHRTLLTTIAGAVTTYLVILFQLK
ncbi:hypothetical protein Zmor_017036 [Zophobas morio]|uniref:Gustatory receptor n=1 Tax=Zophobas morio TaxID=2755281 RepID=A0AA38MC70_9CUCU|nr:hypothetical protein Zmor_017036 [Zophobas morio]